MAFEGVDWGKISEQISKINDKILSLDPSNRDYILLQKELIRLKKLWEYNQELEKIQKLRTELMRQKQENKDPEMDSLFEDEISELASLHEKQANALDALLFPPDERDNSPIFLEIRAGAGGQEASLFAADLARMYMMYATKKNWRVDIVDANQTEVGGFREVILNIKGKGVFGYLKFEAGVHRVQRVPTTETGGRIHTSTVTVAVLPETEESGEIEVDTKDLRIDVYRASGAGGQHVNKTDSAVRITHIPTGTVTACQEGRSQHKNKATAMKMLRAKLLSVQQKKQEEKISKARKSQVGSGMRSEKVRTYNFPQNRVTDHQVNFTLNKLDMVMNGDLEDIAQKLRKNEIEERRSKGISLKV